MKKAITKFKFGSIHYIFVFARWTDEGEVLRIKVKRKDLQGLRRNFITLFSNTFNFSFPLKSMTRKYKHSRSKKKRRILLLENRARNVTWCIKNLFLLVTNNQQEEAAPRAIVRATDVDYRGWPSRLSRPTMRILLVNEFMHRLERPVKSNITRHSWHRFATS